MLYIQYVQLNSRVMMEDKYPVSILFTAIAINVVASFTEKFQN